MDTHPILRADVKVPQHLLPRRQPLAMFLVHRLGGPAVLDAAPVLLDGLVCDLCGRELGVGLGLLCCCGCGGKLLVRCGGGGGLRLGVVVVGSLFGLGRGGGGLGRGLGDVLLCAGRGFVAFFACLDGFGDLVLEAEGLLLGAGAGGRPGGTPGGGHLGGVGSVVGEGLRVSSGVGSWEKIGRLLFELQVWSMQRAVEVSGDRFQR